MSNEELVKRIQGGEDLWLELWEQVKGFIYSRAIRVDNALQGYQRLRYGSVGVVELDELGDAGYIAMVRAVETYKDDCGALFTTWLAKHLLNEFAEAAGYRTKLARLDPIRTASRLDKPVGESGSVLGDFVPDPSQSTERVDEDVWQEQLAAVLHSILEELDEDQRDVIHQRYWLGLLPGEIAEARGETVTEVNRLEHMAIKELRHPKRKDRLREFHRFDCYRGTGLKAYRSRGASVQEQYIMWKGVTPNKKNE